MDLKQHIRHVPNFPKAGILFYDITTLLRNAEGFAKTIDMLSRPYVGTGVDPSAATFAAVSEINSDAVQRKHEASQYLR